MNSSSSDAQEPDSRAGYTLEVFASIAGVSVQTILEYQEHGILRPRRDGDPPFDDEALLTLRRIEHLRDACAINLAGLKLFTSLLEEVEQLRAELRARR